MRFATLSAGIDAPTDTEVATAKKYRVAPTPAERAEPEGLIGKGKADARKLAHARVPLQADEADGGPARADADIAAALDVGTRTVERVRRRFVEDGTQAALLPKPTKRIHTRAPDGAQEARLVAPACSAPPDGKRRWALRLPAERMVEPTYARSVSHETVRRASKQTSRSPACGRCGASRRRGRPSSSPARRTCSTCTTARTTRPGRWCAWTGRSSS